MDSSTIDLLFTRLNFLKMGPLQFCPPIFIGIHRHPKEKKIFLMVASTGHGHPGPFYAKWLFLTPA
jgi:hypothetical protein